MKELAGLKLRGNIKKNMKVIVIIATYNESENIESLVEKILKLRQSIDVLIVDDNSPDGTGEAADRLSEQTGRVFVIHRPGKLGLGSALKAGMNWAVAHDYELVCTLDADHSHSPEYLPGMIEAARDADVVVGSRYVPGGGVRNWPPVRKLLSRLANLYARTIMGLKVNDCTSGYRVYSRNFLATAPFDRVESAGFSFLVEMLYEAKSGGFKINEFPIIFVDRIKGISKVNVSEMFKGGWNLIMQRLFRNK